MLTEFRNKRIAQKYKEIRLGIVSAQIFLLEYERFCKHNPGQHVDYWISRKLANYSEDLSCSFLQLEAFHRTVADGLAKTLGDERASEIYRQAVHISHTLL